MVDRSRCGESGYDRNSQATITILAVGKIRFWSFAQATYMELYLLLISTIIIRKLEN